MQRFDAGVAAGGHNGGVAQPLVIIGESVRDAARSAIAAGYEPWCVDLRGDRDLREFAAVRTVATLPEALKLLPEAPRRAAVLLAPPMENHPELIAAIAFERPILGSGADAIRLTREPRLLPSLKPVKGLSYCETRTHVSLARRLTRYLFGAFTRQKYLLKPRRSSGGRGITWWEAGGRSRIDGEHYVQQYIRGTPYSAVFHADGWSCSLLGVAEPIVGDAALGAPAGEPFRVCGWVGPVKLSEEVRKAMSQLAVQVTQRNDLRGLFGVDFVMDMKGTLWPIEINPRYPRATEVLERAEGIVALLGTAAPANKGPRGGHTPTSVVAGRAWVLAKAAAAAPDVYAALPRDVVADVPEPGRAIAAGEPICSVVATGANAGEVQAKLREHAGRVYGLMERAASAQ